MQREDEVNAERKSAAKQELQHQGDGNRARAESDGIHRLDAQIELLAEDNRIDTTFTGTGGDEPQEIARLIVGHQRREREAGKRRRQKEERGADEVQLDGTEVALPAAGKVLGRQKAGPDQRLQAAERLEFEVKRRHLVGQLVKEPASRQVARLNPRLPARRAVRPVQVRRTIRTLRHAANVTPSPS